MPTHNGLFWVPPATIERPKGARRKTNAELAAIGRTPSPRNVKRVRKARSRRRG